MNFVLTKWLKHLSSAVLKNSISAGTEFAVRGEQSCAITHHWVQCEHYLGWQLEEERRKERSRFIYMGLCKELSWLTLPVHVPAGQYDFINVYDMPYFLMRLCPAERIHLHF